MNVDKADIGAGIDRLRISAGLSKIQLSNLCGIEAGNLNRIISGKQEATLERINQLSKALNTPAWVIYRLAEGDRGDQRKAALHDLVEALEPEQIDAAFRRRPHALPQLPHKKERAS